MLAIATSVAGAKACAPGVAPFDCSTNATIDAKSSAVSAAPPGGIVADM